MDRSGQVTCSEAAKWPAVAKTEAIDLRKSEEVPRTIPDTNALGETARPMVGSDTKSHTPRPFNSATG